MARKTKPAGTQLTALQIVNLEKAGLEQLAKTPEGAVTLDAYADTLRASIKTLKALMDSLSPTDRAASVEFVQRAEKQLTLIGGLASRPPAPKTTAQPLSAKAAAPAKAPATAPAPQPQAPAKSPEAPKPAPAPENGVMKEMDLGTPAPESPSVAVSEAKVTNFAAELNNSIIAATMQSSDASEFEAYGDLRRRIRVIEAGHNTSEEKMRELKAIEADFEKRRSDAILKKILEGSEPESTEGEPPASAEESQEPEPTSKGKEEAILAQLMSEKDDIDRLMEELKGKKPRETPPEEPPFESHGDDIQIEAAAPAPAQAQAAAPAPPQTVIPDVETLTQRISQLDDAIFNFAAESPANVTLAEELTDKLQQAREKLAAATPDLGAADTLLTEIFNSLPEASRPNW